MNSLTKYEKHILVFLVLTGLLGSALLHYQRTRGPAPRPVHFADSARKKEPEPLNINTATESELTALKGIGPAIAARIVEYRKVNGYFLRKEDLEKVKGVGPSKFENITEMICAE